MDPLPEGSTDPSRAGEHPAGPVEEMPRSCAAVPCEDTAAAMTSLDADLSDNVWKNTTGVVERKGPRSVEAQEEKGSEPVERLEDVVADFWPEDEDVDEFLAAIESRD